MIPTADAWGVGFDEHPGRARIQSPPPASTFAVVIAARAPLTHPAPQLGVGPEPARHHDRVVALIDIDRLDHDPAVDADRPRP